MRGAEPWRARASRQCGWLTRAGACVLRRLRRGCSSEASKQSMLREVAQAHRASPRCRRSRSRSRAAASSSSTRHPTGSSASQAPDGLDSAVLVDRAVDGCSSLPRERCTPSRNLHVVCAVASGGRRRVRYASD